LYDANNSLVGGDHVLVVQVARVTPRKQVYDPESVTAADVR
jgi:hypothetical protein